TIAISVFFSGIIALTLSPAIAAIILQKNHKEHKLATQFNKLLDSLTNHYVKLAGVLIEKTWLSYSIFLLILGLVTYFYITTPTSFVPDEDQGYLIALTNLSDGASLERCREVDEKIAQIAMKHPAVENVVGLTGFSLLESINRTNIGTNFITLKDWSQRKAKNTQADAVLKSLQEEYDKIEEGLIHVVNPPAIQGLGTVGGLEFWIENRGDGGLPFLEEVVLGFIEKAKERKEIGGLFTTAEFNNLQFFVDLDRYKAKALGVPIADVFQTLQTFVGAIYVNNFNKYSRVYQVIVQAAPEYRERLDNIGDMYVKSIYNEMVPLKSLMKIYPKPGSNLISHFNDFLAARIFGGPAPGYTSGQAINALIEVADAYLPEEMSFGWSGEGYQEIATGGTSSIVLLAGLFMVFLILSALYEKWSLPIAIILIIPFGVFGAFLAIWLNGMPNNVYFQIGLVTLMALSAKNAILIVEFALMKYNEGLSLKEAALEAAKLRFRAIIMTSLTFILGVTPLVLSTGAGAASRHSVGVGVFGGMIAATVFALLFVPFFFTQIYRGEKKKT
ncbi:MAG: hydrophobe/amphiphile efflux-1 family RND transporter, partial [Chlamydiae bacterium]|nr:hydrophobe/amphiphile efflux-1 family RND transporter [Chlamydiota bacterium]